MSLVARLFSGCLIVVTLAVFGAVVVGYGVYRFSDTGTVRGGWSEPLDTARRIDANVDVDNGDVSIADSLPAGPTVASDVALQAEYRAGADSPIARNWLLDGDTGIATLGSEPVDAPVAALRWLRSPEQANWDIGLNPQVPADLDVNIAVGSARLDLTDLSTARFAVSIGVGDADIIVGDATAATGVSRVRVGVGAVRLIVPMDVPVRIQVTAGLSDITAPDGFAFDGTHYTNVAWQNLPADESGLDIVIETGTGSVSLAMLIPATPGPVEAIPNARVGSLFTRSSRFPTASLPTPSSPSPIVGPVPADSPSSIDGSTSLASPLPVDSPQADKRRLRSPSWSRSNWAGPNQNDAASPRNP